MVAVVAAAVAMEVVAQVAWASPPFSSIGLGPHNHVRRSPAHFPYFDLTTLLGGSHAAALSSRGYLQSQHKLPFFNTKPSFFRGNSPFFLHFQ